VGIHIPSSESGGSPSDQPQALTGLPKGSSEGASTPWWEAAFGPAYSDLYRHRDDRSAASEIAGVLPRLRAAGGTICDVGCGNGRHLAVLAEAGMAVIGFDFSEHLLGLAAERLPLSGRLFRADMRQPPLRPGSCAAVTLFFTAFGYFDDATNGATLQALAALLRPGGLLLLDLPDPDLVRSSLVSESFDERPDGISLRQRRRLEGASVIKRVDIIGGPEAISYEERVRLYEDDEIAALASQARCRVMDCWGGLGDGASQTGRKVYWLERLAG
jgi:SAM-dependent methyltransferase